ncbi:hypothetical protein J3D54_000635 [Pseudomonas sp. GGS8]|uniref:hypothetical protein n=1 Tax=Pseudomonas sp. GGS8 TaxID=2817892 RepID=UPI0020A16FF5|nr:hypothetical protein [Pseudomonas sp. GGS8]MCP1441503.1 hypothetical protein [Pseudomonas sp. GGS8]
MFKSLTDKARTLSGGIADKAMAAKDSVSGNFSAGTSKASEFLENNWGKVENVLVNGLLTVTEEKLKDDEVFIMLVEKAYEMLPTPVRLILSRTMFINHTLTRRESLVAKLREKKALRLLNDSALTNQALLIDDGSLIESVEAPAIVVAKV